MSVPHFLLFRQANIICRVGTAHHFLYGAINRHDSEGSSEWIMSAMEVFCALAFTSPSRVDVAQTVSSRIIIPLRLNNSAYDVFHYTTMTRPIPTVVLHTNPRRRGILPRFGKT